MSELVGGGGILGKHTLSAGVRKSQSVTLLGSEMIDVLRVSLSFENAHWPLCLLSAEKCAF